MKKSKLILKSLLFLFLSWLAGFFISTFFPMCYQRFGLPMCFLFGFCTLGTAKAFWTRACLRGNTQTDT